ncbi:arylamine N-acetyltransferase family protein [Trinickia fusca]|uniref:Arylamine N-acetyltransferase n=1 Tax=Trinickia fusca TaxID=2419777 RepID=A0A494XAP8_9BURK|nr:arylamine N-acetyltransferase [Trinickia fusca]RKP45184.1 arylamine N-acetyltransferase [Trinickia fusca]
MQATNFSLRHYFERIGFKGEPKADIATVTELMRCQLFTVPFENVDVQAGKIVSLVPEEIVEKIVGDARGGYCYEVNGVFAMALQALRVPYQFVAARPMFYPARRPRTHMALVVTLDNTRWLCDLGFGSYGIRAPMNLDLLDVEVQQDADTFMLSRGDDGVYLLRALVDGQWVNQYGFDLSPQEWVDFVPANYLNSTHPESIFVQKLVIVQHNAEGRKILAGDLLKLVAHGRTQQRTIAASERADVLAREFGLSQTTQ